MHKIRIICITIAVTFLFSGCALKKEETTTTGAAAGPVTVSAITVDTVKPATPLNNDATGSADQKAAGGINQEAAGVVDQVTAGVIDQVANEAANTDTGKETAGNVSNTGSDNNTGSVNSTGNESDLITDEKALEAVRNYCIAKNPDLKEAAGSGDVYWEISSGDEKEAVVLFRSYTAALVRYYIDRATGETYVTEFVPGITPEEERTDESFNVRDYL